MVGILKIRPPGEAMHFEAESNWFMQLSWGETCGRDRGLSSSSLTSGPSGCPTSKNLW